MQTLLPSLTWPAFQAVQQDKEEHHALSLESEPSQEHKQRNLHNGPNSTKTNARTKGPSLHCLHTHCVVGFTLCCLVTRAHASTHARGMHTASYWRYHVPSVLLAHLQLGCLELLLLSLQLLPPLRQAARLLLQQRLALGRLCVARARVCMCVFECTCAPECMRVRERALQWHK